MTSRANRGDADRYFAARARPPTTAPAAESIFSVRGGEYASLEAPSDLLRARIQHPLEARNGLKPTRLLGTVARQNVAVSGRHRLCDWVGLTINARLEVLYSLAVPSRCSLRQRPPYSGQATRPNRCVVCIPTRFAGVQAELAVACARHDGKCPRMMEWFPEGSPLQYSTWFDIAPLERLYVLALLAEWKLEESLDMRQVSRPPSSPLPTCLPVPRLGPSFSDLVSGDELGALFDWPGALIRT